MQVRVVFPLSYDIFVKNVLNRGLSMYIEDIYPNTIQYNTIN